MKYTVQKSQNAMSPYEATESLEVNLGKLFWPGPPSLLLEAFACSKKSS